MDIQKSKPDFTAVEMHIRETYASVLNQAQIISMVLGILERTVRLDDKNLVNIAQKALVSLNSLMNILAQHEVETAMERKQLEALK